MREIIANAVLGFPLGVFLAITTFKQWPSDWWKVALTALGFSILLGIRDLIRG